MMRPWTADQSMVVDAFLVGQQEQGQRCWARYRGFRGGYNMGLFRDNGKENGNYYTIIGYILSFIGVI